MTENVRKLVGVAAMAALVVVGVVTTSGGDDDTNFTRNAKIHSKQIAKLPEAQQARLAPKFLQQAAPKSKIWDPNWTAGATSSYVPDGRNDGKVLNLKRDPIFRGRASVLEGKGVDGKGGKGLNIWTSGPINSLVPAGKAGLVGGTMCSARKSLACSSGVEGVADALVAITDCDTAATGTLSPKTDRAVTFGAAALLKDVLVSSYTGVIAAAETVGEAYNCQDLSGNGGAFSFPYPGLPLLLAECMESKVGDVFLKSHTEAMAADCVATVMPALSPERAKRLGTYWQTPEQLADGSTRF